MSVNYITGYCRYFDVAHPLKIEKLRTHAGSSPGRAASKIDSIPKRCWKCVAARPKEEHASLRNFSIQSTQNEIKILDNASKLNQLLYKEAMQIERRDPPLNKG